MVRELGEIDVDLAVLFPDHLLKLAVLPQADYAAALARAYNTWLIEEWTSRHQSLLAAIVACPQDPADAAREIERHADRAAVEVGRDDGARHVAQAGVDQQRPLLAEEQVLADVALAEVTLDPVDAAGHLHAGMMPRWRGRR